MFLREYGFGAGIPALRFDWGLGLESVYLETQLLASLKYYFCGSFR